MPNLDLQPQTRHERDYSVAEIRKLAEKFRHLAKDLSDVFIVASRQAIMKRVETDPDEEETRRGFKLFDGLKRRFLERRRRMNYSKPQLVASKNILATPAAEPAQAIPQRSNWREEAVTAQQPVQAKQRENYQPKVDSVEKKPKPAQAASVSLAEAAAGFRATLNPKFQAKEPVESHQAPAPKATVLQLREEEIPKYKKYRDIAEQFLTSKQYPHFRTLLEKAKSELSGEAMTLLRELGSQHGFEA